MDLSTVRRCFVLVPPDLCSEFREAMLKQGIYSEDRIERLLQVIDANHDGKVAQTTC
jgi:hypothetical protein